MKFLLRLIMLIFLFGCNSEKFNFTCKDDSTFIKGNVDSNKKPHGFFEYRYKDIPSKVVGIYENGSKKGSWIYSLKGEDYNVSYNAYSLSEFQFSLPSYWKRNSSISQIEFNTLESDLDKVIIKKIESKPLIHLDSITSVINYKNLKTCKVIKEWDYSDVFRKNLGNENVVLELKLILTKNNKRKLYRNFVIKKDDDVFLNTIMISDLKNQTLRNLIFKQFIEDLRFQNELVLGQKCFYIR